MTSGAAATAQPRSSAATVRTDNGCLVSTLPEELPQNLFGTARANALAAIDRRYNCNGLIIADLSNDATYAEVLVETFGQRVIGLHISRFGDGMSREIRACRQGYIPVYQIGRTYLIELLHSEFQADLVRCVDSPATRRIYEQLASLAVEYRGGGIVYSCPPGKHDDLGISCAMLAWAARHPHLESLDSEFRCCTSAATPRSKAQLGGLDVNPWQLAIASADDFAAAPPFAAR